MILKKPMLSINRHFIITSILACSCLNSFNYIHGSEVAECNLSYISQEDIVINARQFVSLGGGK